MEYGLYLAVVLPIFALCIYKIWQLGEDRRAERARRAGAPVSADVKTENNPLRRLELRDVPTPWGWPGRPGMGASHHEIGGHGTGVHAPSSALYRWVDRLVAEKQTTDDSDYQERRDASMRALLEDRFHSGVHPATQGRKTTNGNGSARPGTSPVLNGQSADEARITVQLKPSGEKSISGVRTPWGW